MPHYMGLHSKKKTKKNRRKRNAGVKSNVKKQAEKTEADKADERDEAENQVSSPSRKKDDSWLKNRTLKLRLILNKDSHEYESNLNEFINNVSSSDEEMFDEIHKQPASSKSIKNAQEFDALPNSIKNLTISQQTGIRIRSRSQSLSSSEDIDKLNKHDDKLNAKIGIPDTPKRNKLISIQGDYGERACSRTPSTKKKDVISTPARLTRRNSAASNLVTNGSNNPYGTPSTSSTTPRNLKTQTPEIDKRYLRELNRVNYRETSPTFGEKPPVAQSHVKKGESNENVLTDSPRKRVMSKKGSSSRNSLGPVNEESNENDPSCGSDSLEDFTPNSQEKLGGKRTRRSRKCVADRDNDFVFEGIFKKIRSTVVNTPTTRSRTPSMKTPKIQRSTPRRKRAVTPTGTVATTPRKSIIATPRRNTTMTPRGRRTLTPGMHQRSANVPKPQTSFQEFRARLHVSFVPKSLPCREAEFNNIFTFLQSKLAEETGGCIYISGVPGTGKTATVNEVISCLKKLVSQDELPSFQFVDINGMKLTEPRQAYVQIQKHLNRVTTSWEQAHAYLHQRFTTPDSRRPMTLLLIDEMDLLCTKRQDVVYNLLDWPTYKSSRLVVITIANTMDLPERVLMGRVTSRLGLTRLTFQSYNHMQLMEIVKTRLKDSDAFKSEAIEFVARKVSAVSGDARRALDICRRATEIAESNNKEYVTMVDVTSALSEMIANPRVQAIKCCSIMERKFLEAVCSEVSRTGVDQVTFKSVYIQFETLCRLDGLDVPNMTQTLEICRKLASWRLILQESGADLYQSILLNVSPDDVYFSKQKLS